MKHVKLQILGWPEMCSREIFMNEKQRLYKYEGVLGYMIFSIAILHNPCGGEVDIFMFSLINS